MKKKMYNTLAKTFKTVDVYNNKTVQNYQIVLTEKSAVHFCKQKVQNIVLD